MQIKQMYISMGGKLPIVVAPPRNVGSRTMHKWFVLVHAGCTCQGIKALAT